MSKLGFAIASQGRRPTYGIRCQPASGTNGWYIWCGDKSDAPDFFQPLHTHHLSSRCPAAVPFLALPPGYGFVVDGEYVDVWFDEKYLVT
ncbi:MAG: immunity protein Imm33 domain-containing protein [Polyangia bacterium]